LLKRENSAREGREESVEKYGVCVEQKEERVCVEEREKRVCVKEGERVSYRARRPQTAPGWRQPPEGRARWDGSAQPVLEPEDADAAAPPLEVSLRPPSAPPHPPLLCIFVSLCLALSLALARSLRPRFSLIPKAFSLFLSHTRTHKHAHTPGRERDGGGVGDGPAPGGAGRVLGGGPCRAGALRPGPARPARAGAGRPPIRVGPGGPVPGARRAAHFTSRIYIYNVYIPYP
jgi:hypothetical protein